MSINWAKNHFKKWKAATQDNMLFPVYKLKWISKIRDIPNASRGSQRMSTSEESVQETVFLSLKQYLIEYWLRFYMSFYILNRQGTNYWRTLKQSMILNTHWGILCSPACKLKNSGTMIWEIAKLKFNHNFSQRSILPSPWSHSNVTESTTEHQNQGNTTSTV